MALCLKLLRYELTEANYFYLGAFRLRIEASDDLATGADPNVFLYRRNPPNPYDGTVVDNFFAVAGPLEMADYPVGEPDATKTYPFFRLPFVEVDLPSTATATDFWNLIIREVDQLLITLDRLESLAPSLSVHVGTLPTVPVPSSDSSAISA